MHLLRETETTGTDPAPGSHLTACGVPGIERIPWGVHLCHFYWKYQDVLDSHVPYLASGLRNGERCVWVTDGGFPALDLGIALMRLVPEIEKFIARGSLRIVESAQWYGTGGMDRRRDPVTRWLREEERALAAGYQGLRIAGIARTVDDWEKVIRYEAAVSEGFQDRRIVALCAYDGEKCAATRMFEVITSHHCTFERRDECWQVLRQQGAFDSPWPSIQR